MLHTVHNITIVIASKAKNYYLPLYNPGITHIPDDLTQIINTNSLNIVHGTISELLCFKFILPGGETELFAYKACII